MSNLKRISSFAVADLAFNLYWQSATLFLLFYYTEGLGISILAASAIYVVASLWDGVVSFVIGFYGDRFGAAKHYRRILIFGAAPLGLAFLAAYLPVAGSAGIAVATVGHMLFRTIYAAVNIPYLAMSSRLVATSRDRALLAGVRMIAGTAAAVIVALGTTPLGAWLGAGAEAYLGSAIVFALSGMVILILVGYHYREDYVPEPAPLTTLKDAFSGLFANGAYVSLATAMTAMVMAVTIVDKSILYLFKYDAGSERAGHVALAAMMVSGALALPVWTLVARRTGGRAVWLIASSLAIAVLAAYAAIAPSVVVSQIMLVVLQIGISGLNLAFWAMLPDAIDDGQRVTGVRLEGVLIGFVALLQRLAIALATAAFGYGFSEAGFIANAVQDGETLTAMRLTGTLVPLALLAFSVVVMLADPRRPKAA